MATLLSLSSEQLKVIEEALSKLKNLLDNQKSLQAAGVFTAAQFVEIQANYDASLKLYNIYKPKSVIAPPK